LTEQAETQISANDYIGKPVYNAEDKSIGDVNDLIMEEDGGIVAAVIGVGGFLGIGEKSVAVPWNQLQAGQEPQTFVMNIDRQTLEQAPAVKPEQFTASADPNEIQAIQSFWQQAGTQSAQQPEQSREPSQDQSR
jgi:sporulation protein YlmC with PRC-barrel domain